MVTAGAAAGDDHCAGTQVASAAWERKCTSQGFAAFWFESHVSGWYLIAVPHCRTQVQHSQAVDHGTSGGTAAAALSESRGAPATADRGSYVQLQQRLLLLLTASVSLQCKRELQCRSAAAARIAAADSWCTVTPASREVRLGVAFATVSGAAADS